MKEKVAKLVNESINSLNLHVDDAYTEIVDGTLSLNIILDSTDVIDLDLITEASRIINPIVDETDLIDEEYVLDISSKEKGDDCNE